MAGIGSWYPRRIVFSGALVAGVPSGYQRVGGPIWVPDNLAFYCVYVQTLGSAIVIRKLYDATNVYSHAAQTGVHLANDTDVGAVISTAVYYGGYIWFLGAKATRQIALYKVSVTTWAVTEVYAFTAGTYAGTFASMSFDGTATLQMSYVISTTSGFAQPYHVEYNMATATATPYTVVAEGYSGAPTTIISYGITGGYYFYWCKGFPSKVKFLISTKADYYTWSPYVSVFQNGWHAKTDGHLYNSAESFTGTSLGGLVGEFGLVVVDGTTGPRFIIRVSSTQTRYYSGTSLRYTQTLGSSAGAWVFSGNHRSDAKDEGYQSMGVFMNERNDVTAVGREVT